MYNVSRYPFPLPLCSQTLNAHRDARFFNLYHQIPTTCYGPEAQAIHGIDESVSLTSMMNVAKVLAIFISDWCGLEPK
jgi:acetylornithine deacetylase